MTWISTCYFAKGGGGGEERVVGAELIGSIKLTGKLTV